MSLRVLIVGVGFGGIGAARDRSGRIVTNWPGYMRQYVGRVSAFHPEEFSFA